MSDGHIALAGNGFVWCDDTADLSLTDGFDVRVLVDLDDWDQAKGPVFAAHWENSGNQRSWLFQQADGPGGRLQVLGSPNGATPISIATGGIFGTPATAPIWMRAVHNLSGAVEFFASPDNSTWSDHGGGSLPSGELHDSTQPLTLGEHIVGKVYAAELRDSAGNLVANPDFRTDIAYNGTTFFDSFGNEWFLFGDATRVSPTGGVAPDHAREIGEVLKGVIV